MTYTVRLFKYSANNGEELIESHTYNFLPYIPRRKEVISTFEDCYEVLNIATSFDFDDDDNNKNQTIEIMVRSQDLMKEWWE